MAKAILMEEFHLTVFAPSGLPETEYNAIHRALNTTRFRASLGRAAREAFRNDPALAGVRVTLTR